MINNDRALCDKCKFHSSPGCDVDYLSDGRCEHFIIEWSHLTAGEKDAVETVLIAAHELNRRTGHEL